MVKVATGQVKQGAQGPEASKRWEIWHICSIKELVNTDNTIFISAMHGRPIFFSYYRAL